MSDMVYLLFKYDYEETFDKYLSDDLNEICKRAVTYREDSKEYNGIAIEVFEDGCVVYRASFAMDDFPNENQIKDNIVNRIDKDWDC